MPDSTPPKKGEPGSGQGPDSDPVTRQVLARLYELEQRIDGPKQWSVGESRRVCSTCGLKFPDSTPFHTVLCPPRLCSSKAARLQSRYPEVSALFERLDYCERCFSAVPVEESYAHWMSVLPEPPEPPHKSLNLETLLNLFQSMVGASEEPAELAAEPQMKQGDLHMRYLLGLFLVRKRVLRWQGREGDRLRLSCRKTDRSYQLQIPSATPEAIRAHVDTFAELFS